MASTSTEGFRGLPAIPPNDPSLNTAANMTVNRLIRKSFLALEQAEGAGDKVRRAMGIPKLRNLSPFLLMDHFASPCNSPGFPDHPHRGQETVTYVLEGSFDHEDFLGNKGMLGPGDLQFMTAGRGIMHSEMPHNEGPDPKTGLYPILAGIQLWVDLPQKLKKCEPRYRDLRASETPHVVIDDGKVDVKIISGQSHGIDSVKELAYTPIWLLDINIKPGGRITQNLPVTWNSFAYTLKGTAKFGVGKDAKSIPKFHTVVFEQEGDAVTVEVDADAKEDAQLLLFAGMPLDQKIVQYGPFVLNTQEEAYQAMMDFQTASNGFERALSWQSEIGKRSR